MNVVVQGRVVERRDCTVGGIEMEKSLVFCAEPYRPVIASAEFTDAVSQVSHVDNIFSIYKSSTGELWIGTTSGLMRYNRKTDDFTRIPEMNKIFVYNILEDCHGKLWLATYSDGVFCYDLPQDKWKHGCCH